MNRLAITLGLVLAGLAATLAGCGSAPETAAREAAPERSLDAGILVEWNRTVLAAAEAEDGFLTLKGLRTAAMMHLAMHDALNAVAPRFATWGSLEPAPEADPLAAAAQAAYEVASSQYPDLEAELRDDLERWLAAAAPGAALERGVELGKAAAAAVLAGREGDGWNAEAEYQWHPMGPGVYAEFSEHSGTPEGFVFGAGWAAATPFFLKSPGHFRSPPPPEIASDAYTEAYREVREVGRHGSETRTVDQSHLAMWWKDFAENSHNRLARELVTEDGMELREAARMFALLNAAIYDAYVNVFENKFFYNHWRPYTAIRWAANDGNPDTEPDPEWDNLHRHTYAFPSYPSAHGTACAAAMTVLADSLGDDRSFTMTTAQVDSAGPMSEKIPMDPPTRSFGSFSEAAEECSLSRVYLGIHFRYDSVAGTRLGRQIGDYAVANYLQPVDRATRD